MTSGGSASLTGEKKGDFNSEAGSGHTWPASASVSWVLELLAERGLLKPEIESLTLDAH